MYVYVVYSLFIYSFIHLFIHSFSYTHSILFLGSLLDSVALLDTSHTGDSGQSFGFPAIDLYSDIFIYSLLYYIIEVRHMSLVGFYYEKNKERQVEHTEIFKPKSNVM